MILTNCAACAAPLAHNAPRCVRCHTRYCNKTCQHDHWRRGHKQICKKIHRGGNAEQYNADKKYKEAVAVAVEACADDTIISGLNLAYYLYKQKLYGEARALMRKLIPQCRRALGTDHDLTLALQENYAEILFAPQNASRKDQREAVAVIADATKARRRIFGSKHPYTMNALETQESANMRLEDFDAPPS